MTGERFDVAVVGAGATGLAAALCLAREGFATCLLGEPRIAADGRTVALLDSSVRFLAALGMWPRLAPHAAPLTRLQIIDDTGSLFRPPPVSFGAGEVGLDAFGWNIPNTTLVQALWEAARDTPGLTCRPGIASGMEAGRAEGLVTLEGGGRIEATLVVAADGARSRLREAAGIRVRRWSYPQAAATAWLDHDRDHRETSTEFHTREGPFTLVPLPGRRSSLVWVVRPQHASALQGLDDREFARAVERQAHSTLGTMRVAGPRGLFPLGGLAVERWHAARLALVGEAAHVLPPIGAQGLNLALRDAAALRDAVVDSRAAGRDHGGGPVLEAYERGREFDFRLRRTAVDGLNRSLLTPFLPLDLLRGAGLLALGGIGPLRRAVMREGVRPSLGTPRLMRPAPAGDGREPVAQAAPIQEAVRS